MEHNNDFEHFLIGHLGGEQILSGLSQTTLPLQFIDQFQQNNGIDKNNLPTVTPVLKLLDLHQISRGDLYLNLFTLLKENLLTKVDTMNNKELEVLLEQTFPYIGFDELKAIPMTVMKRLSPNVPHVYLQRLAETLDLYEECPIEVKRQIWIINEDLFRQKVEPLIIQYVEDPHLLQDLNELLGPSSEHLPSKRRETNSVLTELLGIIGKSPILYNMLIDQIKRLFQESDNFALCNLRSEILMVTHDHDIQEIYQTDATHSFAWCMDACTKEQSMDIRRIKEIQNNFQSISTNNPILIDISMVFANPIASNSLVTNIIHQLREVVKRKQIPKEDENIKYLTFLLTMGLKSTEIVKSTKYKISKVKKQILQNFYPIMASLILDDMTKDSLKSSSLSISSDKTSTTSTSGTTSGTATITTGTTPPTNLDSTTNTSPTSTTLTASTSTTNLMAPVSGTTNLITTQSPLMEHVEIDPNLESIYLKYDITKKVLLTYIIKRISEKDVASVDRYLKFLNQIISKNLNMTLNSNNQSVTDIDYSNEIYSYFGNDFIQSCVTWVLNVKDIKMNQTVIDNFLLKYRSVAFIHKQILRYLLENIHKIHQRDLIHFVQKLYTLPPPTSPILSNIPRDKKLMDEIATMSKVLLDKSGARLTEKNSPLLFEFLKSKQIQQQQEQQKQQLQQESQSNQENFTLESPSSNNNNNENQMDVDQPSSSPNTKTSNPSPSSNQEEK